MELTQLIYFQKVAQLEHLTKAAQELYISQPSLSQTIARLEADVGVPLFVRKGNSIHLNDYGRAFLKRVNELSLGPCGCTGGTPWNAQW